MKKTVRLFFAVAAMLALAVSCEKEVPDPAENTVKQGNAVCFTAISAKTTIENGVGAGRIVKWAVGDEIDIRWNGGSTTSQATSAGTSTSFMASVGTAPAYYGIYPCGCSALDGDALSITVPASQDGTFASANLAVAKTDAASYKLAFFNATALVKFTVADAAYTKAVFKGAKNEAVTGELAVSFGSGAPTVSPTGASASTEVEVAVSGAGDYYFAVIPQTFQAGFSITLYKGEVPETPAFIKSTLTMNRADIINMGLLDDKGVNDFFATPAGTGSKNGKSWDNAMGTAELRAFIQQPLDGDGKQINAEAYYKAAILDGATIHLAEGDYYLAEGASKGRVKVEFTGYPSQVAITFKGGYPAGLTGTSLTGRALPAGSEAEPSRCTAFTGNGETGILLLGNQTNVTFEGITFKDAFLTGDKNAALQVSAGSSGNASVQVLDCRFVQNDNTSVRDDSGTMAKFSSAALSLGKSTAQLSGCYFSGNAARNAPALNIYAAEAHVTASGCVFKNNVADNTSGAAQNGASTDVLFEDCTFTGNTAGSWGGGAFHANGNSITSFTGCHFEGNSAPKAGALSIEAAEVVLSGCSFEGNSASNGDRSLDTTGSPTPENTAGGAVLLRSESSVCRINSTSFTGNTAPNGTGGAIGTLDTQATLEIGPGTVFTNNSAYSHGGAIFSWGSFTIAGTSAFRVIFSGNNTLNTGSGTANGGAVWLNEKTTSSMEYVYFTGNQSGQAGDKEYLSNGGALHMKGVTRFTAENCEFTSNVGRNGGCLNLELGGSSVCVFSNCSFHENTGSFYGGALRHNYGTARFENCSFAANGARNKSGVGHINGDNANTCFDRCTFTGNTAPDGGCFTLEKGKLSFTGCTFTGNEITNQGVVFYVDTNAKEFSASGCSFEYNHTSRTQDWGGGVMYAKGTSPISFEDCRFEGNYTAGRGGVLALNGQNILMMNGCLLKGNHSASGGMIRLDANSLAYLNRVSFEGNYTGNSGGWGVAVHAGNANVCMHNVTSYGNYNTNASPGNCIAFNSDGGWLIVNSTVLDNTPTAVVRANGTRNLTLCNNILINRHTAQNNFSLKSSGIFNDYGHNLFSASGAQGNANPVASDLLSQSDASLGGSYSYQWSVWPYYGVYVWDITLSGFTPATQSEVAAAMQEGYAISDGVHTEITNIGQDFYNWLQSINALDKDGRCYDRTAPLWPGAYQGAASIPVVQASCPKADAGTVMKGETVQVTVSGISAGTEVQVHFGKEKTVTLDGAGVASYAFTAFGLKTIKVEVPAGTAQSKSFKLMVENLDALQVVARRLKEDPLLCLVMAHRGNSSDWSIPENSFPAIEKSIADKVDIVETDIWTTQDGDFAVCHDETVWRTTNSSGYIKDLTISYIKGLSLRTRNNDRSKTTVTSYKMPSFGDFLDYCKGRIYVNVDLGGRDPELTSVIDMIRSRGMLQQVLIYVDSDAKIKQALAYEPECNIYCYASHTSTLSKYGTDGCIYFTQSGWQPTTAEASADGTPGEVAQSELDNAAAAAAAGHLVTVNAIYTLETHKLYPKNFTLVQAENLLSVFPACQCVQTDTGAETRAALLAAGRHLLNP